MPYVRELLAWKEMATWCEWEWIEPITSRALCFTDVPLRDLFRGSAPLGKHFAGPEASQRSIELKQKQLKFALDVIDNDALVFEMDNVWKEAGQCGESDETSLDVVCNDADGQNEGDESMSAHVAKEARRQYFAMQRRYRASNNGRRLEKRQLFIQRRIAWQAEGSMFPARRWLGRSRCSARQKSTYLPKPTVAEIMSEFELGPDIHN